MGVLYCFHSSRFYELSCPDCQGLAGLSDDQLSNFFDKGTSQQKISTKEQTQTDFDRAANMTRFYQLFLCKRVTSIPCMEFCEDCVFDEKECKGILKTELR